MMSFYKKIFSALTLVAFSLGTLLPLPLYAEDALTVSVTPPLFQLTIGPGEFWASNLKIVNSNDYDVTYYASVVNFEASGEAGKGTFKPVVDDLALGERNPHLLATWIDVSSDPIFVERGQSKDVPFTVTIPPDAEPGGHYAAILVGTQPPAIENQTGPTVAVSSYVSSLFFVRIKGDIVEDGRIREFVTEKTIYEKPEAQFVLRFENTGTVHVQPQGNISIYNMWGKERGTVFINQKSNFGNVLPQSTRKFEFVWSGEFSPLDIGRYSAVVTLAYGDEVKRNTSATTYFWVVPIVPVVGTLATFIVLVGGITFFIRRYIRRVLELEKITHTAGTPEEPKEEPQLNFQTFARPIQEGVIDLRNVSFTKPHEEAVAPIVEDTSNEASQKSRAAEKISFGEFLNKYKLFFLFLVLLALGSALFSWYFGETLVPGRTFEITNVSVEEEVSNNITDN